MKIVVSACLLGENCKYNGGNNYSAKLEKFLAGHEVLTVCPEVLGGLTIPRAPGEIVDGVVRNQDGTSVDREYREGAEIALQKALAFGAQLAVVQSRSPSCGAKQIYDGTFSGRKIPGMGVFARRLTEAGVPVTDVEDVPEI